MWLRLLTNPLVWAALAVSLALVALWGWNNSREANKELRRELQSVQQLVEVLEDHSQELQQIENTLLDGLELLANVETTSTCGPAIGITLDRLRSQREQNSPGASGAGTKTLRPPSGE